MSFSASIVSKKGLVYAKNIVFWGKSSGIHSIWGINPQINAIETCEEACVGNDSITLYVARKTILASGESTVGVMSV